MYCNSQNRMRMRMYHCFTDIKLHQRFAPMVSAPDRASDMKPHVVSPQRCPPTGPHLDPSHVLTPSYIYDLKLVQNCKTSFLVIP